jgi:hypothetical protein
MLKRRDRLSPKRRERRLDITGYIEGLLLESGWAFFPAPAVPLGYAEGEASIIINRVQATAYSLRFAAAFSRAWRAAFGGAEQLPIHVS